MKSTNLNFWNVYKISLRRTCSCILPTPILIIIVFLSCLWLLYAFLDFQDINVHSHMPLELSRRVVGILTSKSIYFFRTASVWSLCKTLSFLQHKKYHRSGNCTNKRFWMIHNIFVSFEYLGFPVLFQHGTVILCLCFENVMVFATVCYFVGLLHDIGRCCIFYVNIRYHL